MTDFSFDSRSRAAPRRAGSSSEPLSSRSPTESRASRASAPPSEPRAAPRGSGSLLDTGDERPGRLQMMVALVLGLVLVAIPLYLWRRPRAEAIAIPVGSDAGASLIPNAAPVTTPFVDDKLVLGAAKNVACQDRGPSKTPPEQCDHLVEVEKAFAKAIEESTTCMPKEIGGSAVLYLADVSFRRQTVNVATRSEGRSSKRAKAVSACRSAVKHKLQALALEPLTHAHARYKIAILATYPGSIK